MVNIYQFKSNGKHILINLKAYLYIYGELKIEPTPIRPWELSKSRKQEWFYLVWWSSIGTWVIHEENTWMTSDTGKIPKNLSTKASELNHMLLFQGMSKILVHRYNFLQNT